MHVNIMYKKENMTKKRKTAAIYPPIPSNGEFPPLHKERWKRRCYVSYLSPHCVWLFILWGLTLRDWGWEYAYNLLLNYFPLYDRR